MLKLCLGVCRRACAAGEQAVGQLAGVLLGEPPHGPGLKKAAPGL